MADLPRGTVTFLFTDIEGSTALWERDRQVMAEAVERHIAVLDAAIQTHGGVRSKTVGVMPSKSPSPLHRPCLLQLMPSTGSLARTGGERFIAGAHGLARGGQRPRQGHFSTRWPVTGPHDCAVLARIVDRGRVADVLHRQERAENRLDE